MMTPVLHCPYGDETAIVRHGKSPEGKQRSRCWQCLEGRGHDSAPSGDATYQGARGVTLYRELALAALPFGVEKQALSPAQSQAFCHLLRQAPTGDGGAAGALPN